MADEVLIVFKADTGDLDKAVGKIEKLTKLQADLKVEVSSTYSNKQLDVVIDKLEQQVSEVEKLGDAYSSAAADLKEFESQMAKLTAQGSSNTKQFRELEQAVSDTKAKLQDTGKAITELASGSKAFGTMADNLKGLKGALGSVSTIIKSLGGDASGLESVINKASTAINGLEAAQNLVNEATKESGVLVEAYGIAVEAVEVVQNTFKISSLAAWAAVTGGVSLAIAALVSVIDYFEQAEDAQAKFAEAQEQSRQQEAAFALKQKEELIAGLEKKDRDYFETQNRERNRRLAEGQKQDDVEFDMLTKKIEKFTNKIKAYNQGDYDYLGLNLEDEKQRVEQLQDYINLATIERNKLLEKAEKERTETAANAQKQNLENFKKNIDDEIAKLEEKRLYVAQYSQEDVRLYAEVIELKKKLAEGDPSLSSAQLSLALAKQETAKQEYAGRALQIDLQTNAAALSELKTNHSLQQKLQKDFNLTQQQVDKMFDESGFESFADFEKQKRSELEKTAAFEKDLQQKGLAATKESAAQKKELQELERDGAFEVAQATADAAFSILQQQFEAETNAKLNKLERERNAELKNKNLTEEQKAAINAKYDKKMADIKRRDFERNKAAAVIQAIINTALAVVNAATGGDPYTAPIRAAIVGALGAAQIAVIAAQPVPEFEQGGPVVLGGGRLRDGHLYGRSHRRGGMLINAQGGEYIWDIPTVQKHGDIIRAAHQNRLEDLVMHKYIVPALQRSQTPVAPQNTYDDFMLRSTIKQGHEKDRRNAEYIAATVTQAVTNSVYNQNRYR